MNNKKKGNKIVYCAFGSIRLHYRKEVIRILKLIIEAIKAIHNTLVIIAVSNKLLEEQNITLPDNIFHLDFAPQQLILSHSDIFVTHGGLNSIKKVIHFYVPILAYQINKKWDNFINCAWIAYHGIGKRGKRTDAPKRTVKHRRAYCETRFCA